MIEIEEKFKAPPDTESFLYLNLEPEEKILMVVRHHWAGFLPFLALFVGMILMPFLLLVIIGVAYHDIWQYGAYISLILSGYVLFLLTFLLGEWCNYYYDIIFITNRRIININQVGLLSRQSSEVNIVQIQNVSSDINGFFRSMFDFGKLVVETAGEGTSDEPKYHLGQEGYFTIEDVPNPSKLARLILDLHREAMDKRGLTSSISGAPQPPISETHTPPPA